MTKVTIINEESTPVKKKKPIEFVKQISVNDGNVTTVKHHPKEFKNVCAILTLKNEYDIFWCYDTNPDFGFLYLGHYNDGVVE